MAHGRRVSVIGLGYVGLPVAVAFGRHGPVVGFDCNAARIQALQRHEDGTGEVGADDLAGANIQFTADPASLRAADFHIVAVPTPVTPDHEPDLGPLRAASETIGAIIKQDDIVVFESTVYPGVTEEICIPIIERISGLRAGAGFRYGYSPERINPGDRQHTLQTVIKVVAGSDAAALDIIAAVYGTVARAGVYRAPSVRVAEAAKVIENTQRDLNIALMNELSLVFQRMGLDTMDVVRTAATKWNFIPFAPGLVGGHCIGVDPYYLTHKARALGYMPQVILAGRAINDGMGAYVAARVLQHLEESITGRCGRVALLGFAFKENIPDTRNSGVAGLYRALVAGGAEVRVHDPHADTTQCHAEYGITLAALEELRPADAVVLAVPHRAYVEQGWTLVTSLLAGHGGLVFDVRAVLDRATCPAGVKLVRL